MNGGPYLGDLVRDMKGEVCCLIVMGMSWEREIRKGLMVM